MLVPRSLPDDALLKVRLLEPELIIVWRHDFVDRRQRDDPCIRVEVEGLSRRVAQSPATTTDVQALVHNLTYNLIYLYNSNKFIIEPRVVDVCCSADRTCMDIQRSLGLSLGRLPMPRHGADRGSQ